MNPSTKSILTISHLYGSGGGAGDANRRTDARLQPSSASPALDQLRTDATGSTTRTGATRRTV